MPEPDCTTLREQVAARETVQRFLKSRMVQFHFGDMVEALPRLTQAGEDDCLVHVRFTANRGKNSVAVVAHRGVLSTLEFTRPPGRLASESLEVLEVVKGGTYVSLARAADRLEHGRE